MISLETPWRANADAATAVLSAYIRIAPDGITTIKAAHDWHDAHDLPWTEDPPPHDDPPPQP